MKYVIDTNIINKLVDGLLRLADLPQDGELLATHVQIDELNNTTDRERRFQLFLRFRQVAPALVPAESFVFDISRFDLAKLGRADVFLALKAALDGVNGCKSSNAHDPLIAEVAIVNGFALLTSDYHLAQVAEQHGANVRYFRT